MGQSGEKSQRRAFNENGSELAAHLEIKCAAISSGADSTKLRPFLTSPLGASFDPHLGAKLSPRVG
jgi:hypothetical protein